MADISSITLPDKSSYGIKAKKIFYAECSTARNIVDKVVSCDGFVLETGAFIVIRFTDTTTITAKSGNMSLNINGTGAKNIVSKGSNSIYTYGWEWAFCNNQTWLFVYNGTYFVQINQDNNTTSPEAFGIGYATCSTAETTSAKVAAFSGYVLKKNGIIAVKFTYAVPANATLNVNSKGAKNIFYRGAKITAGVIKAGDIATFVYDRTQYQLISVAADYARKADVPSVDSALSSTSTNPVQNKVVNSALAGKAASSHTHSDYALKSKYGDTTIDVGRKADTNVGEYSTAEGRDTTASGNYSHAEGYVTTASENCSHAEGNNTTASGNYSHAEGINTIASGRASHAGGVNTKALHNYEVAYGSYNISNEDTLFSIGDGTTDDARHNAFEITTTGGKLHDKDIATTDLAGSSKSGLMSSDHYNFIEKYKKIRGSSASYTFTSMQDYITVNNCYGNCTNGLVVLSGWFTSTGSAGNPAIISGSFPSPATSFVCGIIVNIDSPNTNTRLLIRHESDGTSSLQCGGSITAGKYFFIGVYTAERCTYNLPYTL